MPLAMTLGIDVPGTLRDHPCQSHDSANVCCLSVFADMKEGGELLAYSPEYRSCAATVTVRNPEYVLQIVRRLHHEVSN